MLEEEKQPSNPPVVILEEEKETSNPPVVLEGDESMAFTNNYTPMIDRNTTEAWPK